MPETPAPQRLLSIDDILAADDLPTTIVSCPEWGGDVQITALSREQVVQAIERSQDGDEFDRGRYQMELVLSGMRLTEDRLVQLNKKHTAPLKRIAEAVKALSGLDEAGFRNDD